MENNGKHMGSDRFLLSATATEGDESVKGGGSPVASIPPARLLLAAGREALGPVGNREEVIVSSGSSEGARIMVGLACGDRGGGL